MATSAESRTATPSGKRGRIAPLVVAAGIVTLLGVLHHADHVIRGDLVLDQSLPSAWNHSGWPFQSSVTPFTASLAIYLLLVPGMVLTLLGRVGGRYWMATGVVLGAILAFVHFVPHGPETEYPSMIYSTYGGGASGVLALVDVFALVAALVVLVILAVRARHSPAPA